MLQNIYRIEFLQHVADNWGNRLLVQPASTSVAGQLLGCQVASASTKLQVQPRLKVACDPSVILDGKPQVLTFGGQFFACFTEHG